MEKICFSLSKSGSPRISYYINLDKQTVVLNTSNGYYNFHVGKAKFLKNEKTKDTIIKLTNPLTS